MQSVVRGERVWWHAKRKCNRWQPKHERSVDETRSTHIDTGTQSDRRTQTETDRHTNRHIDRDSPSLFPARDHSLSQTHTHTRTSARPGRSLSCSRLSLLRTAKKPKRALTQQQLSGQRVRGSTGGRGSPSRVQRPRTAGPEPVSYTHLRAHETEADL
eukprot:2934617-Rhodomonas_salina.1